MRLRRLDDEDDEDYDEDEDDDMSGGLSDAQMRRLGNKAQWTPLSLFASSVLFWPCHRGVISFCFQIYRSAIGHT